MPVLNVTLNHKPSALRLETLIKTLSAETASMLVKPESYVMVLARHETALCFAGTLEPCAYLELKSIGLPADKTPALSARLCELLETHAEIPAERIYIEFTDVERHLFGWDGSTF